MREILGSDRDLPGTKCVLGKKPETGPGYPISIPITES